MVAEPVRPRGYREGGLNGAERGQVRLVPGWHGPRGREATADGSYRDVEPEGPLARCVAGRIHVWRGTASSSSFTVWTAGASNPFCSPHLRTSASAGIGGWKPSCGPFWDLRIEPLHQEWGSPERIPPGRALGGSPVPAPSQQT
jgi:hypothetical protein